MDQLDLLKKDWKKQDASLPKFSQSELSKLIHKKSSSIVKWIFIISLLEFIIPHLFLLVFDNDSGLSNQLDDINLKTFYLAISIIFYVGALIFIYLFYKNYQSISANSNPKVLMQNILKTRKTVKYYIWFAISFIPIVGIAVVHRILNSEDFLERIPEDTNMILVWGLFIVILGFVMFIFWLFYQLLYGILLSKLTKNYKELVNSNGEKEL